MNKSVYISFVIFDMGKTDVFQFRQNYIKDKCNNKARLCQVDTYSIMNCINTEDFWEHAKIDLEKKDG